MDRILLAEIAKCILTLSVESDAEEYVDTGSALDILEDTYRAVTGRDLRSDTDSASKAD